MIQFVKFGGGEEGNCCLSFKESLLNRKRKKKILCKSSYLTNLAVRHLQYS